MPIVYVRRLAWLAVCGVLYWQGGQARADFLDRPNSSAVRVASWNIYFSSIFPDVNLERSQKFARVLNAIDADVWAFQEIYGGQSAAQLKSLLDDSQPLGTPDGWQVFRSGEFALASKYPIPATYRSTGTANRALVDLPDDLFAEDLYLMNNHFKCCGGFDNQRQNSADFLVNWMRDARTPDGTITLPEGTPMIALGDFNIVDGQQPLTTLQDGNIINNAQYGADSPPDWDGSGNLVAPALHNAVGPEFYTWRDDRDIYAPSLLDFIIYTDSVASLAHSFVLNTATMTDVQRTAAGLQTYDAMYDSLTYDHLPLVADFVIPLTTTVGDANGDRVVDGADLEAWRTHFGLAADATTAQGDFDANGQVDGADFLLWQREFDVTSEIATVPEPSGVALAFLGATLAVYRRSH
jgi:endonuclease/exonuclease/phosphatase family metal-dependent hydrolase